MKERRFEAEEMFGFCTQMNIVLSSGIPIQEGLLVLTQSSENTYMEQACQALSEKLKENGSFYNAVKEVPYFDAYAKQMIRIGEMSGNIEDVMKELALYYQRNSDLKQQLHETLTYPSILIVMMWVVVALLQWKVLPIFQKVLASMQQPLSVMASNFLAFGRIFAFVSFIILTLLIIGIVIMVLFISKDKGKDTEKILANFFFTKKLIYKMTMAKITYALSLFVASGYSISEAFTYLPELIQHPVISLKLAKCNEAMKQGAAFEKLIIQESLYEGIYANMLVTGFMSGKSDEVFQSVSNLYVKDVENSMGTVLNRIEPAIVISLSVIVGIILLSLMLPLMGVMGSIG